jgi:4-hydroxyphenylpyruvate dioxygenase
VVGLLPRPVQLQADPLLRHRGQAHRPGVAARITSPCGKIRIPLNESTDDKSQIEEYLRKYNGEGIQHIAVGTDDIYAATDWIADKGVEFMPGPPETYYDLSYDRVKGHDEPIEK